MRLLGPLQPCTYPLHDLHHRLLTIRPHRVVYALFIINKAGSLIYQRDFAEGLNKLSINDYLVLAGTFHSVHALTTRLHPLAHLSPQSHTPSIVSTNQNSQTSLAPLSRPEPPSGIEVLETENFRLQCFQALTGTKFLLFTEPTQPNVDVVVRKVYELYADYVMKNPFYVVEMPIRCDAWERKLQGYIRPLNSGRWGVDKIIKLEGIRHGVERGKSREQAWYRKKYSGSWVTHIGIEAFSRAFYELDLKCKILGRLGWQYWKHCVLCLLKSTPITRWTFLTLFRIRA